MTTDILSDAGQDPGLDEDATTAEPTPPNGKRRYYRSCAIGGGLACMAFIALLLNNGGFFAGNIFGGIYEVQARAFAHGRWNIPENSIGIEAFRSGDQFFMYYGPWPALIRMPLMAIFPGMNGKWSQPSMLAALIVALCATSSLSWNVRNLVRGEGTEPSRLECWAAGIFTFVVGGGSVFLFLASFGWVYHEAELWGAAMALAAFAAILNALLDPRNRTIAAASAFAALAILSRPSVGFGPIFTLLLLAAVLLTARTRRWFGLPDFADRKRLIPKIAAAGVLPISLYIYTNFAKFGTFFTFPSSQQIFSQVGVYRREMLAQNNESLFGLKFFPTSLVQYLRPDALRFRELAPFVNFPRTAPVIGDDVLFDTIEPSSSATSTMPLLVILAVIGVIGIFRATRSTRTRLPLLRVLAFGALAGAVTVVPYSYIGNRYMSDFVPLLVITGLAGTHITIRWVAARSLNTRKIALGFLAALAVFSLWVNASLGYTYHYETELVPESTSLAYHLNRQYKLHDKFPGGSAPYVEQGSTLPYPPLARGTIFVVGDCEGVYWSQGNTWEPSAKWYAVGRTEKTGEYRLRMKVDPVEGEKRQAFPVIIRGEPGRLQTMAAFVNDKTVRFGFLTDGHPEMERPEDNNGFSLGPPLKYKPGETYDVNVVMDPNNGAVTVVFEGYVGFAFPQYVRKTPEQARFVFPADRVEVGRNPHNDLTEPAFKGSITQEKMDRPFLCDTLNIGPENTGSGNP